MNEHEIYEKTAAGADEVRQRTRGLPPRVRTMLIMVDGVRNVAQLDLAARTLAAPEDYLALLKSCDLVRLRARAAASQPASDALSVAAAALPPPTASAPLPASSAFPAPAALPDAMQPLPATDAERFRAAQKLMNDCAVDALGLRALLWTLRLEKAATGDDLRKLLPDYGQAMTRARGAAAAALLETRVRSMLG